MAVHYARTTARDSIGHVKKCLFGNASSDVQGSSVGSVCLSCKRCERRGFESRPGLFFFLVFFFFLIIAWILLSYGFKSRPGHFFSVFFFFLIKAFKGSNDNGIYKVTLSSKFHYFVF